MNKAHCAYYTNFVNENYLNKRKLFLACKSLLSLSKCASLPLHSVTKLTLFGLRLLAKVALPTLANPTLDLMASLFLNFVIFLKLWFMN